MSMNTATLPKIFRNMPLREVVHRAKVLLREDAFELSARDWKQNLKNLVWQNDLANKWHDKMMFFDKDPYNLTDRESIFNKIRIDDERKQEIDEQVEHDLFYLGLAEVREVTRGPDDAIEYVKANAQTEFLRDLDGAVLLNYIHSWSKARTLEAQKGQKQFDLFMARVKIEAERCGFDHVAENGTYGFKWGPCPGCHGDQYDYEGGPDLEGVKADLLLAQACRYSQVPQYRTPPCNDGLDIINRRWSEPGFRRQLDIQFVSGEDKMNFCQSYLRRYLQVPVDLAGLNRLLSEAIAEHDMELRRRADASRRQRQIEEENRRINERIDRRGGGDTGGGYNGPCGDGGSLCGGNVPHL